MSEQVAAPRGRMPGIDGVRALGALGVLVVHVGLISGFNMRNGDGIGQYFARGEVGVTIFFVVSGFLIYRPFVAANLDARPVPDIGRFLVRRLVRIVPLYWLVLTIVLFVQHRSPVDGLGDVVTYYGFLQIYRPGYEVGGVQQAWSLCTIVAFYLVAPMLALAVRAACDRLRASRTARFAIELGVIAVIFVVGYAFRWMVVADYAHDPLSADGRILWLPTNADTFAVGMALAVAHAWGAERGGWGSAAVRALDRVPGGVWWALSGLCFWAVATQAGLPHTVGAAGHRQWMLREVLYTGTALFLLLPTLFGPPGRGLVRRFIESRPMIVLGTLSYGVFLWHEYVLDEYRQAREIPSFGGWFWGMLAVTLAGSLALAAVTWFAVERPTMALATRWTSAGRPPREAAPVTADPASGTAVPEVAEAEPAPMP
jgi:peptidoglycan/LPS O-acetylase OafA/YrhL